MSQCITPAIYITLQIGYTYRVRMFIQRIVVKFVVESESEDYEVKCIFCGNLLDCSEMVRYRGAISYKECADKQKSNPNPNLHINYYLAGIGCLIGIFSFIYFSLHIQLNSLIYPVSYVQPLVPFFSGIFIAVSLISIALYTIKNALAFAVGFAFFLTRKRMYEEIPIRPV